MQPQVEAFFHEPTNTASYVVRDSQSHACAIVDSVLDFDAASGRTSTVSAETIASYVEGHDLRCEWILETHAHADHLSAAPYLKERLKSKIGIGSNITIVQNVFGKIFNAGTEFQRDGAALTGRQSHVWLRCPEGWRIAAAHVSLLKVDPVK